MCICMYICINISDTLHIYTHMYKIFYICLFLKFPCFSLVNYKCIFNIIKNFTYFIYIFIYFINTLYSAVSTMDSLKYICHTTYITFISFTCFSKIYFHENLQIPLNSFYLIKMKLYFCLLLLKMCFSFLYK